MSPPEPQRSQAQTVDPDVILEHRSLFSLGGECLLILSAERRFFFFLSFSSFLSPPSSAKKPWLNVGEQSPKVMVCNVLFCFDGSFWSFFQMKPSQDTYMYSIFSLASAHFSKTTVCRSGSSGKIKTALISSHLISPVCCVKGGWAASCLMSAENEGATVMTARLLIICRTSGPDAACAAPKTTNVSTRHRVCVV